MILSSSVWSLADDFHATFTTDRGQRVLAYLKAASYSDGQSTTGDEYADGMRWTPVAVIDPLRMAVNEGRRQLYDLCRWMMELAKHPDKQTPESAREQEKSRDAFGDEEA